jgi:hypothetical protein
MLYEKIIDAQLFSFGENINSSQDTPIFIEISSLDLHYLVFNHAGYDFFHPFAKLLCLSFTALWSVNPIDAENEASWRAVEVDDSLDGITISDLADLCQKSFIV